MLERELAEYEKHGMYTVRQEVLCYLAELECRVGRWHLAAEYAAEAMETVVESGQTATQSHVVLFNQAYAAAHLGQAEEAQADGGRRRSARHRERRPVQCELEPGRVGVPRVVSLRS